MGLAMMLRSRALCFSFFSLLHTISWGNVLYLCSFTSPWWWLPNKLYLTTFAGVSVGYIPILHWLFGNNAHAAQWNQIIISPPLSQGPLGLHSHTVVRLQSPLNRISLKNLLLVSIYSSNLLVLPHSNLVHVFVSKSVSCYILLKWRPDSW